MSTSFPGLETPAERIARQAGYFRRLAELNMASADIASDRIHHAHAHDEDTHKPTLDLSRATRAVVQVVNAENSLFAAAPPLRAPAADPRRAPLREALHQAAKAELDPSVRAKVIRLIDAGIEQTLLDDPDGEISLCDHFLRLAEALDLPIDPSKLSDEILGIEPRIYPPPGSADTGDPWRPG